MAPTIKHAEPVEWTGLDPATEHVDSLRYYCVLLSDSGPSLGS